MIATTVPVTIDADAAEQIERRGLQVEFERMLEHAIQTTPGLIRLEVSFPPSYEMNDDMFFIDAYGKWDREESRRIEMGFLWWMRGTFAEEIWASTILVTRQLDDHDAATVS